MTVTEEKDTPPRPYEAMLKPRDRGKGDLVNSNLVLTVEQKEWLDARAREQGMSRSDVARRLFRDLMQREREREARKKKREETP